jgi:hypothetical protein
MDRRTFLGCVGCTGVAAVSGCALLRRERPTATEARKPEDLAYCGIDCTVCDVYKATLHGDEEARRRAHKLWEKTAQVHWGMKTLDPAILNCKGCRAEGSEIFRGCRSCPIRRCCRKRGLASCGLCPEWRDCERLAELFADTPQARKNLEAIAASAK